MRLRCKECKGNGIIEKATTCPDCLGTGSDKITVGVGSSKGDKCPTCKGKGKLYSKSKCETCIEGYLYSCDFCGNDIDGGDSNVCETCEENPIVIQLIQPLDAKYLTGKRALLGRIEAIDSRNVRVDLGCGFRGSFNPHDRQYKIGNSLAVRLRNPIVKSDRGGNPVPVVPLSTGNYKVVKKHLHVDEMSIDKIKEKQGTVGLIHGQITDIYQLKNGPTLFTMTDTEGKRIQGSAFGEGEKTAFPNITRGTVVRVVARYRQINEKDRLQIYSMDRVKGHEAFEFINNLSGINQPTGKPIDELNFYVESSIYSQLKPNFVQAATRIRSAILQNQNIIMRYHSPCVDGASAAFAIDYAIRQYLQNRGVRKEEFRRFIRRMPQRNPILEIREVVRDLSFALDDGANYRNLPLYVLIDIGSTEDSKPALDLCKNYDLDVIVLDHHHLDEGINEKVHTLINSNEVAELDTITSGMLAVELAQFISAEQSIADKIIHLAALSGFSEHYEGLEYEKYLELAKSNEFDKNRLDNINSAVDYVLFGLRHFDGGEVVRSLLGASGSMEKNIGLIESITPTAKSLYTKSLKIALENSGKETLDNDVKFVTLDLENYTPRFDYPAHSTILNGLHNSILEEDGGNVFSMGIASDYLIIRSSALDFNFPEFLSQLQEDHQTLGIKGNGHLSNGFMQFYSGHKDQIVEEIKKSIES
ncbi:MAG: DHH family phosphoesterase [Candidatus Kariarchaeaceae archaeon]|jgi:RecJ-like exonuclease